MCKKYQTPYTHLHHRFTIPRYKFMKLFKDFNLPLALTRLDINCNYSFSDSTTNSLAFSQMYVPLYFLGFPYYVHHHHYLRLCTRLPTGFARLLLPFCFISFAPSLSVPYSHLRGWSFHFLLTKCGPIK